LKNVDQFRNGSIIGNIVPNRELRALRDERICKKGAIVWVC